MIHIVSVPVPRPAMTSNDQRRWHWTKVRDAKSVMQSQVWVAVKQARIPALSAPIRVTVTWYPPNRIRRDVDALGPWNKATLDALVAASVIPDDSHEYVSAVTSQIGCDYGNPRIDIRIEESESLKRSRGSGARRGER